MDFWGSLTAAARCFRHCVYDLCCLSNNKAGHLIEVSGPACFCANMILNGEHSSDANSHIHHQGSVHLSHDRTTFSKLYFLPIARVTCVLRKTKGPSQGRHAGVQGTGESRRSQ